MSAISSFYHRHSVASTSSKPPPTTVIPFRNANGELRYTSAPTLSSVNRVRLNPENSSHNSDYLSDSDGIPLLASPSQYQELTDDERARFTATGRPMRPYASNPLHNMGGDMFTAPRYLPKQYTDESIIPVIIVNVTPSQKPESPQRKKRSKSITSIFKGEKAEKDASKKITKIVFMPRGEYLKHFAKDDDGNYIGTMPQKEWTEDELDEKFGIFRPLPLRKKGNHGAWNSMTTAHARGL